MLSEQRLTTREYPDPVRPAGPAGNSPVRQGGEARRPCTQRRPAGLTPCRTCGARRTPVFASPALTSGAITGRPCGPRLRLRVAISTHKLQSFGPVVVMLERRKILSLL